MSHATETVLQNHLRAAGVGVDAIMEDFGETVLITKDATFHELKEIRHFFTSLFDSLPDESLDTFTVTR